MNIGFVKLSWVSLMHLSNWNVWNGHSKYSQLEVTMHGQPFQHNCSLGQMVKISQRLWSNVSFGKYSTMITWSCLKQSWVAPDHSTCFQDIIQSAQKKKMVTEMGFVKFYNMWKKGSSSDRNLDPQWCWRLGGSEQIKEVQSIPIHWHLIDQLHGVQNTFNAFIYSFHLYAAPFLETLIFRTLFILESILI